MGGGEEGEKEDKDKVYIKHFIYFPSLQPLHVYSDYLGNSEGADTS